jgi:hypothetical protein
MLAVYPSLAAALTSPHQPEIILTVSSWNFEQQSIQYVDFAASFV